ncbi:hypothetical protein PENARI_c005G02576 [Penicillium arizonense]|uniref:BIR-domain-containing protein n=1 Tax=Penicillium arizonense TaxID=1835702 RepID=A0A1F5LNC8_PENAI|nr:hypothetical protein PENARI_c005G02576 [Penicillium arizonense]OGE54635.1 hypothetical protein PENARI_c005G02576 [Penicillium arizonense]
MGSEMDTFAARLASFDLVLKPEKRRSSGAKTPKAITWPHQRPSPAELAHAGFFYKPYETNPDNTTCFECHRALDGWEEEDNPITEHLKHAPDCGWAIMMDIQQNSSNPSSIEDPTNERITQARASTFGSAWPHDGKRGWLTMAQMVEGGWYFCPTEESNDLASCAYCKLSLDGWEPKDDPFEEHYRRSSDCSFFVFAQPPGKKGKGRAKKPRVSKASSRLSTQSAGTVASETPEVDMDDSMDQSMMSQSTTKSKPTKKASKGKGKGAKSRKEEPAEVESHIETESAEVAEPEPVKAKRTGRGKKRASEDITKEEPVPIVSEEPEQAQPPVEPPAKRRATRTRSSSISRNYNYERSDSAMPDADTVDDGASEEETRRGRKPTKKASSKARKVSDISVTSKAPSKARAPRDSEIEAEIEAGLDADIPELLEAQPEPEPEHEVGPEPGQPRASKKAKATKKPKAVARSPEPVLQEQIHDAVDEDHMEPQSEPVPEEVPEPPAPKTKAAKGPKKKGTKKAKAEETKAESPELQGSLEPMVADDRNDPERHESFISVEIINKEHEPSPEPEEPVAKPKKKGSKKKDASTAKEKKSKKLEKKAEPTPPPKSPILEQHDVELSVDEQDDGFETADDLPDQLEVVQPPQESSPQQQRWHRTTPNLPPKTAKRYSDIPKEEHLAESIAHSSPHDTLRNSRQSNRAVSPLPSAHRSTPSMSPQSSDAENRPPSSRPSASRGHDQSTPKEPKFRAALTASTPSPSKRNANAGFGPSGHPWTPIDIDEALFGDNSDKENADLASLFKGVKGGLTSPEKKMTVQEWIAWNAKNGEERLKRECERLVGQFEKEGGRAMQRIEAIECVD